MTILAALVSRGYRVLLPFGVNHRYDLVIDDGGCFVRVQCKTGRLRDGRVLFNALSTRSNTTISQRNGYKGQAELFLVWCPDTDGIYCIAVMDATQSVVTLRVEAPRNGQRSGVRWAADHTLDVSLSPALELVGRSLGRRASRGLP